MVVGKRYWQWLRVEGDPRRLPMELDYAPSKLQAGAILLFSGGLVLMLGPHALMIWSVGYAPLSAKIGMSIMPLLGLSGLLHALLRLFERKRVRIKSTMVEGRHTSIFGVRQWREPITRYTGVQHHTRTVKRGRYGTVTLQIIELIHPEPGKSLPLMVKEALQLAPTEIERYARALGRPVLVTDAGEIRPRDVANLDKPVFELLRDGRLKTDFNPATPPPAGIAIASSETHQGTRLLLMADTSLVYPVGLLIILGASLAAARLDNTMGLYVATAAALTIALLAVYAQRQKRELVVADRSLSYRGMALIERPFGANRQSIALRDIEDVRVDTASTTHALVIEGRNNVIRVGTALPDTTLSWLKGFLLDRIRNQA